MLRLFSFIVVCCILNQHSSAQPIANTKPKIGLVLSGGGAKGLAHIGVLKVLEEAGIHPDFIAGTSMGSIVGGLYALGYSANQLDSIAHSIEWDIVLSDKVGRNRLSMNEKDEVARYMVSFPLREKRIKLPSAIVRGQNISILFSRLTASAYQEADFSKFPIPFFCMATDIEHGKAEILNQGVLAEAMRASMAIPTVFSPVEIDGKIYLDGGLLNNFPIQEMKAMGADIIIGVDAGFQFFKANELNSMVRIMEQSVFMHSIEQTQRNVNSCQVYIKPDLHEYNASSFNHTDSMIARGERAARAQLGKLKLIAAQTNDSLRKTIHVKKVDRINIQGFEVWGLRNVPAEFIYRKLPFDIPGNTQQSEIEEFVEGLYGTEFFESVTYSFVAGAKGETLVLKVKEKNSNFFRAGFHYDNDFKATLLLNTTYRNVVWKGSKITVNLALGENPSLEAQLYRSTGWNPQYSFLLGHRIVPDYGLRLKAYSIETYEYIKDQRVASFNYSDASFDLFSQSNLTTSSMLSLGGLVEFSSISNRIGYVNRPNVYNQMVNIYLGFNKDSYNQTFYPSSGTKINVDLRYAKNLSNEIGHDHGFLIFHSQTEHRFSLSDHVTFGLGSAIGSILGDSIPTHYRFFVGGQSQTSLRGYVPFLGVKFMQIPCYHYLAARSTIQWEMWNDNFLIFKTDIGKSADFRKNLLNFSDINLGAGLSFAYRSPIGPMELTFMSSSTNLKPMIFINIGCLLP